MQMKPYKHDAKLYLQLNSHKKWIPIRDSISRNYKVTIFSLYQKTLSVFDK